MRQGGWWNRASEKDGWGAWGGYMAAKVQKLDEQFQSDAPVQQNKGGTSSKIFHGISIYVNGYTDPSADHLRHLMMLHGGQYHLYYSRSKTTHIIATNLPNNKIKELKDEKVVRPEWIMESIKAGHLLSYVPYQLYTKQSSVQKRLNFTFMHNSNDAAPGPSNITRELVHDTNHTTKEFPLQSSISRPNGVSGWEEDDDEHKDDLTLWDSNQVFSKHKPNGLQSHKGNKAVCSKYSCNSNGALKSLDNTVHSSNSFPDKHCSLPQQEIPSPGTDLSVEQLQSIGKESDAYYNPQRTVSTSPLPSSSHLHSNLKVNGAHRSLTECSSTNSTMNSLTKLNSPQLPKTTDPNFISDFYSHSRLHHISTWKCEFTEFVRSLQTQSTGACPGRERLKKLTGKTISAVRKCQNCIIHVDMDCFFVSVAIRNRADLKGKPVAVTSNRGGGTIMNREGTNPQLEFQYYQNRILKGKSEITDVQEQSTSGSTEKNVLALDISHLSLAEIASCSYEARQAGVKNGMFFGKAKQICPDLQAVPYDFESYKEVAMAMYKTLASYTRDIEAVSCDEALADITGIIVETKLTPDEVANAIRMEIKEKTGCAASIGMGSNILLARMATRKAKPDGQYHLKPEEVDDFIRDQPVNNLPGVGRSMEYKLSSLGVKTCGDLQSITMSNLQKEFGPKTGQMLYRFCRGLDDRPIQKEKERKSVSAEINYGIRFTQQSEAEAFLFNLSEEIQRRLEAAGVKGKKLTLKIMVRKAGAPIESAKYGGHGICDNVARSVTLDQATDCAKVIGKEAVDMFHTMKLNISDMRGIGLQVHQLVSVQRSCNYGSTALKSCALPGGSRSLMNMFQGKRIKKISEEDDKKETEISGTVSTTSHFKKDSKFTDCPSTSKAEFLGKTNGLHPLINDKMPLNFTIDVPSPSQIDPSVFEALPPDIREQVEQTFAFQQRTLPIETKKDQSYGSNNDGISEQPVAAVLLQIPHLSEQGEEEGINVIALPAFSQVDPEVFAALPVDLQEELKNAYDQRKKQTETNVNINTLVSKNRLLQIRKPLVKSKKRSRKKDAGSPTKKAHSPLKNKTFNSPLKNFISAGSPQKLKDSSLKQEAILPLQSLIEEGPSTSKDIKSTLDCRSLKPKPSNLAGAVEYNDVKTLLKEWITTISDPMEEDILQVLKYCTDLIEEKDLEKLDLVIKYMKRLMQQSVESVWNMAFDFILDNVQVVLQQTYGSTLKVV